MKTIPKSVVTLLLTVLSMFQTRTSVPFVTAVAAIASPLQQAHTGERILSGYILSQRNELLPGITVIVRSVSGEVRTASDSEGHFRVSVPSGYLSVRFEGKNVTAVERYIAPNDMSEGLEIKLTLMIAPIQESVVIQDTALNPMVDRRSDTIYKNTLFERDDQLVQTLNAGINAGQT